VRRSVYSKQLKNLAGVDCHACLVSIRIIS
jgi:hypothetical protein